jgi:molybdopterin-biosynthesis enzyme MoeA-like protein
VDAVNALRHCCTYCLFSTGGIGPTHGDITAACVAKAFGVPIDADPRALAILHEWVKTTGAEMNEARLRLTRIPKGADLILNKVSGAPGLLDRQCNRDGGVPSIMQAMLDEVAPSSRSAFACSETVRADVREGDIGMQLGAKANPAGAIGSYRSSIRSTGRTRMWCCAPEMHISSRKPNVRRGGAGASAVGAIKLNFALSRRKQGFRLP